MRDGSSSQTAAAVALARAATGAGAVDRALLPYALLPGHAAPGLARRLLDAMPSPGDVGRGSRWLRSASVSARVLSGGLVDHLRLRTAAIDAAVTEGVARGCERLVLLGAGLDARAHRLEGLGGVDVWEVDHPDTQRTKIRAAAQLPLRARAVRYVPVRFGEQDLAARLLESGWEAGVPTVWVWEGVTMYLQPGASAATLASVAELSAPGSLLAMTYARPTLLPGVLSNALAGRVFSAIGEPLVGLHTRAEAAALVQSAGFAPRTDTGARRWAAAHGGSWRASALFHAERLLIAERCGPPAA